MVRHDRAGAELTAPLWRSSVVIPASQGSSASRGVALIRVPAKAATCTANVVGYPAVPIAGALSHSAASHYRYSDDELLYEFDE